MADDVLSGRCAIVMAHPDDEVLWASSILRQAERVVICFGDIGSCPEISAGRRAAMAAYPLPGLKWLALPESETWDTAAWPDPEEAVVGVSVRRRLRSMAGWSATRYRDNFAQLKARLRDELAGFPSVVTHNPWGEYGHEEHVQVFRVVDALRQELGFAMWVTNYASNRSDGLMRRWLPHLGPASATRSIDATLTRQLRDLYIAHGCWTWTADYVWPGVEVFYRWTGRRLPAPLGAVRPVTFIWFDLPPAETAADRAKNLIRRAFPNLTRILRGGP